MRIRFVVLLLGSFVVAGTEVHAQTCRGSVSIAHTARGIVDFGTAFSNDTNAYGVNVGGGSNGWFAAGGLQGRRYPDLPANTWAVTGMGGGQFVADPGGYFEICPMGTISWERTSNLFAQEGVTGYTLTTSGGVSAGVTAFQSSLVALVPTAGVFISSANPHVSPPESGVAQRETFWRLQTGMGVLIGNRFSITPLFIVPLDEEDGQTTFVVSYSYSFGRR
jgi:hypothetical protein